MLCNVTVADDVFKVGGSLWYDVLMKPVYWIDFGFLFRESRLSDLALPGLPFLDIIYVYRNVRVKIDSWLIGKHSVVIPSKTAASLSVEWLEVLMSLGLCWECQAFSHVTAVSISRWSCRVGGGLWHLLEVLDDRHSRRTRKENDQSDMEHIFMTFWAHFTMLFENIWTHPSSNMFKYVQINSFKW